MKTNLSKQFAKSLTFTFLFITAWFASITTVNAQDNLKPDLLIDLSNPVSNTVTVTKSGTLTVLIINMVPAQIDNYYVLVDAVPYTPGPLESTKALQTNINDLSTLFNQISGASGAPGTRNTIPRCLLPQSVIDDINNATTSSAVAAAVAVGNAKLADPSIDAAGCTAYKQSLNLAVNKTKRIATVTVNQDYDSKITVSLNDTKTILSTTSIQPTRKQWITSYGFGFVDNRDENYYSKGNSTDGYVIAKQEARDDFSYSALAIFTYPFSKNSNGFEWGFSGGIGASQDNVTAMTGLSLVVNKNFIITGGVTFQEFSVLKGQYNKGDNIGATPIDSDVLEDQTYKASPLIVLSYRFGAGGSGGN